MSIYLRIAAIFCDSGKKIEKSEKNPGGDMTPAEQIREARANASIRLLRLEGEIQEIARQFKAETGLKVKHFTFHLFNLLTPDTYFTPEDNPIVINVTIEHEDV
jgi:hypothetical protein